MSNAPDWEEFRRSVRHELRTPVNHILSYGQLLIEDAEQSGPESFVAELRKIQEAGREALTIIGAMLDAAPGDAVAARTYSTNLFSLMESVEQRVMQLRRYVLEDGNETAAADLDRIATGARRLVAILAQTNLNPTEGVEPRISKPAVRVNSGTMGAAVAGRAEPAERRHREGELRGRILVVEDNELSRDAVARMLERLGHTVLRAENGRRALEIAESDNVDLMLLDIVMPEMSGYDVLERCRERAELREIPIIMISALDELSSVVRCIEMGAEDYLPKPFDPVLLRARIGACLEKKRLRDQEVEYLRQVAAVTDAAAAVEDRSFTSESLALVASRPDALGQLARVFDRMAREVIAREEQLLRQVQQLQIQVDEAKKAREVADITNTEYFQQLQRQASTLRRTAGPKPESREG